MENLWVTRLGGQPRSVNALREVTKTIQNSGGKGPFCMWGRLVGGQWNFTCEGRTKTDEPPLAKGTK